LNGYSGNSISLTLIQEVFKDTAKFQARLLLTGKDWVKWRSLEVEAERREHPAFQLACTQRALGVINLLEKVW
jgi:hypothetical protein